MSISESARIDSPAFLKIWKENLKKLDVKRFNRNPNNLHL